MLSSALITHSIPRKYNPPTRAPLLNMVLPMSIIIDEQVEAPTKHVWWIEQRGRSYFLRAKIHIVGVSIEHEIDRDLRYVKWHLDTTYSERITWQKCVENPCSNITEIISPYRHAKTLPTLHYLTQEIENQLENRRLRVFNEVPSFSKAISELQRTIRTLPLSEIKNKSFQELFDYLHIYFAREELANIPGHDPYLVSAAFLHGAKSPTDIEAFSRQLDNRKPSPCCLLEEFRDDYLTYSEWCNFIQEVDTHNLAEKTRSHQTLVGMLAKYIRQIGLTPLYNLYIDVYADTCSTSFIFEVKTVESGNFLAQIRKAVGQLLEYRFRHRSIIENRLAKLVVVIEAYDIKSEQIQFAFQFLNDIGIELIVWQGKYLEFRKHIEELLMR